MVITSENKRTSLVQYKSTHFRYAMTYVVITFALLLFLNIYSSKTSQAIFYSNKESYMLDRCNLATEEIAGLQVINRSTVAEAISRISNLRMNRIIMTDESGKILYDSVKSHSDNVYCMFPEVQKALKHYDVFNWKYSGTDMTSKAAVPIISYGNLVGCVYMLEHDSHQASVLQSLQINILSISLVLEAILIIFSLFFSHAFTKKLKRIMQSIRIIRSGDYSHKVSMKGNDELAVLGNEFDELTERLQTSEHKRQQFVSDASHELKTPLAAIKLLSDSILQNEMDMDTTKEFVSDIGDEADRLNKLSEKLLNLMHIESRSEEEYEITYIAPTIRRVVKMLSAIAQENHITIETNIQQDCSILMLEDDLYQVIFNLAENGIKYNVAGGILKIQLCQEDDNMLLTVSDTGMGIPEDSIEHIFERFYRVDKARSRKSGGSGLGLAIVRNIIEKNNGTIKVESAPGKGTVFFVSFPVFDIEDNTQD